MTTKKYLWFLFPAMLLVGGPAYCEDAKQSGPQNDAAMCADGARIADLNATRMRAADQRLLNGIIVLFPESIHNSGSCYQSAYSNFVEDEWNRIAKVTGCDSIDKICGNPQPSKLPEPVSQCLDKKTEIELANGWGIAGGVLKFLSPISQYLMPNDEVDSFFMTPKPVASRENISPEELKARIAELNKYIANCDSTKPVAWSVVGTPFASPADLTMNAIKLGEYKLLIEDVLGFHLPDDKKGYVGCLNTYVEMIGRVAHPKNGDNEDEKCHDDKKCIETIPVDTKEFLFQQLDDLKAHKCSATYVYVMGHPEEKERLFPEDGALANLKRLEEEHKKQQQNALPQPQPQ